MKWQEVLDDKSLQDIPYKIELNRWGQIVMSPAKNRHAMLQGRIAERLRALHPGGGVFPECAIDTSDNVKVADVVWLSPARCEKVKHEDVFSIAPEICVEVASPSNTAEEMMIKRDLYLERGAVEFWLCDEKGTMSFYNKDGKLPASLLVPGFPSKIEI
ncbi:MAG: Uma2 family endonuclease [Planctomycetota bacterium]|nr:Uma2 family endonuclease [Planctomycetota bacterium]